MKNNSLIVFVLIFCSLFLQKTHAVEYGETDTNSLKTKIPSFVKPEFDYWMRDTWVTTGPDGYYYMTGTTADPERQFSGQPHCWDWNDGLYLWKSKNLKKWEAVGLIWSMERDGRKILKFILKERNILQSQLMEILWIIGFMHYGHRNCIISRALKIGLSLHA